MARLFVSDVHLDSAASEAVEQFVEFLSSHAARAEALYMLGDLFETWVGDDDSDPVKRRVVMKLRALADTGVGCFVLHGNRDFLIGRDFCRAAGVQLLVDPIVMELNGERVLLTHGDALCTDDRSYQELRSIVRSKPWQRRFLALPVSDREMLANAARAGSRAHTSRTGPDIMDVNEDAVERAFKVSRARRMIHGHTHRPAVHDSIVEGVPVQRIVLGAWYEQGSYLHYDAGSYELRTLPR